MRIARFFWEGSELPDLVIVPLDLKKPRREANKIEKMLFYREKARGKSKIIIVSKKALSKVGGFEEGLGFGEDRLYEKKLFSLFKMTNKERKEFKI